MIEPAPIELSKFGCNPAQFSKAGANEWHGPCPKCGGRDRFVIFTDREFPHWNYMCRVCTPEGGWIDQLNKALRDPMTEAQRQEYARQQRQREQEQQEAIAAKLKEFTSAELWNELHRRMGEDNRQWWRERGISDAWQDYLRLGYTPDKAYRFDDLIYHSPAYTIPYLRESMKPITMQYRLTQPAQPNDKYRFENNLPSAWYNTTPDQPLTDGLVICEGAIKAIVTKMYMMVDNHYSVLAVPSKSSWAGIANVVKEVGRVWVVLDPDGQREANNLALDIGPNARVIELPGKIDDMINADELDSYLFAYAMKTARTPRWYR